MRKLNQQFGSLGDLRSPQDSASQTSIDNNYFLSIPIQAYEQIEKMKILKAKYPAARQSYQIQKKKKTFNASSLSGSSVQLNNVSSQASLQKDRESHRYREELDEIKATAGDASSFSQTQINIKTPNKRTSIEIPQSVQSLSNLNSYRKSAINFNAIYKIEKGKLLPEILEARQQYSFNKINTDEFQIRTSRLNIEDSIQEKTPFKNIKTQNPQNSQVLSNLPRKLNTTYRIDKLLESSEKIENESSFIRQQYLSNSKLGKKDDKFFRNQSTTLRKHPLSKQQIQDINQYNLRNKLDYFSQDNMIYIKIPHVANLNIEPLEKYDEEQLYDQDFQQVILKAPIRGYSKWSDNQGNIQWKDCIIESYNPERRTFGIQWISNNRRKEVTRINLLFDYESQDKGDQRYQIAKERREQMLFFLSMKNTIINSDMKESSQTNINLITFPMDRLQRILDQSLKWRMFSSEDEIKQTRDLVIEGTLELYKYNVIKFNYQFHTVTSMYHFYQKYLQDFAEKRGLILFNKSEWVVQEYFAEQEQNEIQKSDSESDDEQNKAGEDNLKNKSQLSLQLNQSSFDNNNKNLNIQKALLYQIKTIRKTYSAVERKKKVDQALANLQQRRTIRFENDLDQGQLTKLLEDDVQLDENINIKIYKREVVLKNKSYIKYNCNKLGKKSIIYSKDKKFELFSIVVPMLAQFVTCLKEIKIFKGIQNIQLLFQQDALNAIKSLTKDFSRQSFKLQRVIDKIESALDELNKEFLKNLQNYHIEIEGNEWRISVQAQITKMTNSLIQSYLISTVNDSIQDAIKSLDKYYSVLPMQYLVSTTIKDVAPNLIKKRQEQRLITMLDRAQEDYADKVSIFDEQNDANWLNSSYKISVKQSPFVQNNTKKTESSDSTNFKFKALKRDSNIYLTQPQLDKALIYQQQKNKFSTIEDISPQNAGNQTSKRDSIKEFTQKIDHILEWQCFKDGQIIYDIYQQICDILIHEQADFQYHQIKHLKLSNIPIQPIFQIKMNVLNDKTEEGKKQLKLVTKFSQFKHIDTNPEIFLKALESRDKFYYYEQVTLMDMYFDIARRNHSEFDLTKQFNIDNLKKNIVNHQLAWFNLNSFMIRIEPPLDVIEQEIKNVFMSPIESLEQMQKIFFGTIEDKMNEINAHFFNQESKFLYKQEFNQKNIENLQQNLQEFITNSYFAIYGLLKVLLSFEFYFLYSKQYEKFLIAEIESNQLERLEEVFKEMDRLYRDMHIIKSIMPDKFNLGVFLVDVADFKAAMMSEIMQKDALIKNKLKISCIETLKKNEDLEQAIQEQLSIKPQTIDQYIKINQYLQGEEITQQIQQISMYILLSQRLFEQIELYQMSFDEQNYRDFLLQNSMLRNLFALKEEKEKKQEENKPKFRKMHMDKKNLLLKDIEILKKDIEDFSNMRDLEEAHANQTIAENLKQKLTLLNEKIKEIRYEEIHLNTGYDGRLDYDEYSSKFEYYNQFWKFASDWKYVKQQKIIIKKELIYKIFKKKKETWLSKSVINNILSNSDLKDIEQTLEVGNKMIRQVETYFLQNDYEFSMLVNLINNEINEYEQIYDFLVLVSHESFKQEHWNLVLETLYTDDPDKKKQILASQNITLQKLLEDKILSIIVYIKSIAGQAENEFKVHESIKSLENELKKIGFQTINYFGIPMFQSTSELSSYLKLQQQIIGNMVRNKIYSRNDFAHKLSELQQQVASSKKVLKYIGLIQNLFIKIIPVINFTRYLSYMKDGIKDFNRCREYHEQIAKDLKQRGLLFLLDLFMNKEYENHAGDKTNRNNHNNNANFFSNALTHHHNNHHQGVQLTAQAQTMLKNLMENYQSLSNLESSIQTVIKFIRQQNSRFTFFSDFQIMNLCESVYNTKEFSDTIRQAFLGIQSFNIITIQQANRGSENSSANTPASSPKDNKQHNFAQDEVIEEVEDTQDKQRSLINNVFTGHFKLFQIWSIKNWYNEQINFNEPIQYSLQQYDDPPTFTMIRDIESSSRSYIKQQILQQLNPMSKNSYNYQELWNIVQKKQTIFQILYLINDIIFYHDLTIILATKDIPYIEKLTQLRDYMNTNLKSFIQSMQIGGKTYGVQRMNYIQSTQFFLQILQHIEILNEFIDSKQQFVEGLGSYEYLVLPKFSLHMNSKLIDNVLEVQKNAKDYGASILNEVKDTEEVTEPEESFFPNLTANSPLLSAFKGKDFDICLISMNYKKSYTYEINPQMRGFVITQGCRRIFHQLLQALSTNSGGILKGPQATGKSSTFETLCILLAKPHFVWKFEHDQNYNTIQNIITGVAAGGFWLYIKSLETCDLGIISTLAQAVFLIRKSLMNDQKIFQFAGKSYPVHSSYGIVSGFTDRLNVLDHKFAQLPKSLLENFRVINVVEPDLTEIVKNYFILYGCSDKSQEYSNKFISFLRFISSSYENTRLMKFYSFDEKSVNHFKESIVQDKFSLGNLISLKAILKILRLTLVFHTEKQLDLQDQIKVVQASVQSYFSCLLTQSQCDYVMKAFCSYFGTKDQETNYSEIFDRDYMSIQSDLSYYLTQNNLINTEYVQKLTNNIFPLVMNKNTLIFSGRSGKNKSFFIKLLGYLYFKQKKKEFYLNWLKIDAIAPERLLGCFNSKGIQLIILNINKQTKFIQIGEWEEGVVNQIIASMESNNHQKNMINKIKYYGHKNFCSYPASQVVRDEQSIEKLKFSSQNTATANQVVQLFLQSKAHDCVTEEDWIIIDASSQANKYPHNLNLDRLLVGFYQRSFNLINQDILKVPQDAFCIFEMESLDNMSPNHLANHILIHMNQEPFSLKEEFSAWLSKMKQKNIFFGQFDFAAKICFAFFFEELLELFDKIPENSFRYIISKKAHLNNFLNYLEIFINEIRKLEIASGEWEDENNKGPNIPRMNLKKIKNQQQLIISGEELISEIAFSPTKIPPKKGDKFRFQFSEISADEVVENATSNSQQDRKSIQGKFQNAENDSMNENVQSKQQDVKYILRGESDVRLASYLESVFVFALTWSVGNILKNEYRSVYNKFLQKSIEAYLDFRFQHTRVRFQRENYPFAINLKSLFESSISNNQQNNQLNQTIFDFCYDIVRAEWVPWQQLSIEEFGVISGNLISNNIDTKEIIRLNPYAIDIIENKISKEVQNISLPDKTLFVETKSTKITKHFLQYFVAYQKPLLLISRGQNGLTTLVNQRTQTLIEQFNYSPIFISCTQNLSVKQFQKKIESNLISSQPFVLTSPNKTNGIIIVDDLNLAPQGISPVGAIRSFIEGNSWFSNSKNRFYQFQNIVLLGLYSHSGQQSTNIFDQRYCNLPLSMVEKSMIFKMPNQDQQDLISIFTEYNSLASAGQAILLNKNQISEAKGVNLQLFSSASALALVFMKHKYSFYNSYYFEIKVYFFNKRYQLAEISCNLKVNMAIQKALEVIRNLNYFDFSDSKNSYNIEQFVKSLIFLMNQFYAQEFIHSSCETEERFSINRAQDQQVSYAPSITKAYTLSDESNERNEDEEIGIIHNTESGQLIEETQTVEFIKQGLVQNLNEIESLQSQYVEMTCFEKLYFFTNILDDDYGNEQEQKQQNNENLLSNPKLKTLNNLRASQQKIKSTDVITASNLALAIQREVSIEMKTKMNQQNDDIISQSEIVEELYQKRVIQVWHTPSRHASLAFKSTFMQKASKFKTQEKNVQENTQNQETAYKLFLQQCADRVENIKINNNKIEILPDQLVANLIQLMINKSEDKMNSQNWINLISKRNDTLFFNEELFDENYGQYNSKTNLISTTKDFGLPNFRINEEKSEELIEDNIKETMKSDQFMKNIKTNLSIEFQPQTPQTRLQQFGSKINIMTPKQIDTNRVITSGSGDLKKQNSMSNKSINNNNQVFKDEQKQIFTFVGRKQQKRVVSFLIEKIKSYEDKQKLIYLFQIKENTFYSLYFHSLKLMHLLQMAHQNILLQSIISLESATQLTKFVSFCLKYKFIYFNPSQIAIDSMSALKDQFRMHIEQAIDSVFTTDFPCVFFINMSEFKNKDYQYQTYILETVNNITKGSEITSLFSRKKWESYLVQWKMHKRFIGLSNHILYYLISCRLTKKLKIVLYYEPKPTKYDYSMELIHSYQKLLSHFSKYTLYIAIDPQKKSKKYLNNRNSVTELFQELSCSSIDNFEEEKIKKIYYKDFEIQKIYQKNMFNFNYTSYQQAKFEFYYTFNLIKKVLQENIYRCENQTTSYQLKELCAKKIVKYEKEIQQAQQKLDQTNQILETYKSNLKNAQNLIVEYEAQIASLHEEEKQISEIFQRAYQNESICKAAEREFYEPINKLIKMDQNLFNEDIQVKKMTQVKQMNQYIIVFFVLFGSQVEHPQFSVDKIISDIKESSKKQQNYNPVNDTQNMETYREIFELIFSSHQTLKKVISGVKESHFKKEHYDILSLIGKVDGKIENAYLFSLSNNFNLIQRDVVNAIELAVKFTKSIIEKRKVTQTSQELDSKIKDLRFRRSEIEHLLKEPKRVSNDLPPKIANLILEKATFEQKIALKQKGISSFLLSQKKIEDYYYEKLSNDTNDLNSLNKLNEVVLDFTVMILFLYKYPNYIQENVIKEYSQINGIRLTFFDQKIPILLENEEYYFQMLKMNFPQNQQIVDRISVIQFLQKKDAYYPPLIVDQTGVFYTYLRQHCSSKNIQIILENTTVGKDSKQNIIQAIKQGQVLILSNFDDKLIQLVQPILDWKTKIIENVMNHFLYKNNENDQNIAESFEILKKYRGTMNFHDQLNLKVHENFRIYFIYEKTSYSFSASFLKQVYSVTIDMEDETSWKQSMNDLLIQQFHKEKKDEVLNKYINIIQNREKDVENMLQSILERLNNNITCEDVSLMKQIEEDLNSISSLIYQNGEEPKEIFDKPINMVFNKSSSLKVQSNSNSVSKHKLHIPEAEVHEEESPQPPIQIESRSLRLIKYGSDAQANPHILENSESKDKYAMSIEKGVRSQRNSVSNFSSQIKIRERKESVSSQVSGTSMISAISYSQKKRQLVLPKFNKKTSIQLQLDDAEQEAVINEDISCYKDLDEELNKYCNLYIPIIDFIHGVKMNWINLGKTLGSIYAFSEVYMILLVKQTTERCIKEKSLVNLNSESKEMNNFSNRFCENILYIMSSIFREDHLTLFNFQLAIMYQRGLPSSEPDSFNELEWKFFLNQRIENLNKADIFGDQIYEYKWINILEKLINHFNLSDDILAPILNKYQIDLYGQQSESNSPSISVEDIDTKSKLYSESKKNQQHTTKAMSKFKNLINKDTKEKSSSPSSNTYIPIIQIKQVMNDSPIQDRQQENNQGLKIQVTPAIIVGTPSSDKSSQPPPSVIVSDKQEDKSSVPQTSLNIALDQYNQNLANALGVKLIDEKSSMAKRKSYILSSNTAQSNYEEKEREKDKDLNEQSFTNHVKKFQSQSNFIPQLRELPQQKQIQFGITSYKSFYSILPFLGDQSKLRIVLNSISDHAKEWINYLYSSAKIQKRNEDKIILFKEYPNNILNKITAQEAMLVSKYFRPDCLLRFGEYFIRKCFKSLIKSTHKTSMDVHVSSQWYKRPTILFFNQMDKSIAESLELKAAKNHLDSFLVRLNCGFIPVEELCIELENAAGAGSWVIIENMENLQEKEMAYLIRKINQELENQSTTQTFKVWISIALTSNSIFKNQDFICKSEECCSMMKNLAQTSWKIFLNKSSNIKQIMERLFNIEAQEYKAYRDQKQSQYKLNSQKQNMGSGLQSNINSSSANTLFVGGKRNQQEKILMSKSNIFCGVHKNLKSRLNRLNRQGIFNFLSILNVEHHSTQYPEQQELITKFSQKYRFGLAFVFSIVKYRENYGMNNVFYQTDFDFYYILDDILQFLECFPTNPKVFLEKYVSFLFPFQRNLVLNYVKKYVTSSMDQMITLKVKEDQFQYQLYNFQGNFNNVEEAIIKTLNQFPIEDPLQVVDLSQNQEFIVEYQQSKYFLDKVIEIEKRWDISKISTILSEIQELIESTQERQKSMQQKFFIHQQQQQQLAENVPNVIQKIPLFNKRSKSQESFYIQEEDLATQQKNFPLVYLQNLKRSKQENENLLNLIDSILEVIKLDINIDQLDLFIFQNKHQQQIEKPIFYSVRDYILLQNPSDDEIVKFKRKDPIFQINSDQFIYPTNSSQQSGSSSLQNRKQDANIPNLALNIPQKSKFTFQQDQIQQLQYEKDENGSPSSASLSNKYNSFSVEAADHSNLPQIRKRHDSIYSPTSTTPIRTPLLKTKQRDESGSSSMRRRKDSNPYLKLNASNSFEKDTSTQQEFQEETELQKHPELIQFQEKPIFGKKDVQLITKTKVPEKLLFSNEFLIASRLVYVIRYDLLRIKEFIKLKNDGQSSEGLLDVIKSLQQNKIPYAWWKTSFLTEENQNISLINFIKLLLCKLEYINTIFKNNKCQLTPVISLSKLFDPLGYIQSMVLKYAVRERQNILGIKIVLTKITSMAEETQILEDQANISGLTVRNGKINKENFFLEEDNPREFEQSLQQMKLIVTSKPSKLKAYVFEKYYDPIIAVELYDLKMNSSYNQHDMEGEFYNQLLYPPKLYDYNDPINQQKEREGTDQFRFSQTYANTPSMHANSGLLNPNHSRNQSNQQSQIKTISSNKKPLDIELTDQGSTQINYAVRIPIVNPCTDTLFCQFPTQYYLYIYSKKPQDYWERRGTKILINNLL
ncbi:hypothetical protein ABPG74_014985 [Tetrahymena malaccensis]